MYWEVVTACHPKGVHVSVASWILQNPASRGQMRGGLSSQWDEVPPGLGCRRRTGGPAAAWVFPPRGWQEVPAWPSTLKPPAAQALMGLKAREDWGTPCHPV